MARSGRSDTDDRDLSLYQLHCRYAILGGLDMTAAAALWQELRPLAFSREQHMAALLDRLPSSSPSRVQTEPSGQPQTSANEGRECLEESVRRDRSPAMTACRLELDAFQCQHCGFRVPLVVDVSGNPVALRSSILEVHHIKPIQEGERCTVLSDLVTLCPTCHRLLHAIGAATGSKELPVSLLKCSQQAATSGAESQ